MTDDGNVLFSSWVTFLSRCGCACGPHLFISHSPVYFLFFEHFGGEGELDSLDLCNQGTFIPAFITSSKEVLFL